MFKKTSRSESVEKVEVHSDWLKQFIVTGEHLFGIYLQDDD